MSAPLRKMCSLWRLDTKFLSARNFSSKEVPEAPPGIYERCAAVALGGTFGLSVALFCQKLRHGRVISILGFPVGNQKLL